MGGGQSPQEREGGEKRERERAETRGEAEEDPNLVLRGSSALGPKEKRVEDREGSKGVSAVGRAGED